MNYHIQGNAQKISAEFSEETLQVRLKWHNSKAPKQEILQSRRIYLQYYHSKLKERERERKKKKKPLFRQSKTKRANQY